MFKAPQRGDQVTGQCITYRDGMSYTFEMHATLGDGRVGGFLARSTPKSIDTVILYRERGEHLFSLGVSGVYAAEWNGC